MKNDREDNNLEFILEISHSQFLHELSKKKKIVICVPYILPICKICLRAVLQNRDQKHLRESFHH